MANIGDYRTVDFVNSFLRAGIGRHMLPRVSISSISQQIAVNITTTQIVIEDGTDAKFDGGYITIRYTKQ